MKIPAFKIFRLRRRALIGLGLAASFSPLFAQVNAEQVLTIGRNVLSMEDYMLSIQYFNQAIKAKPYLPDPYFSELSPSSVLTTIRGGGGLQ